MIDIYAVYFFAEKECALFSAELFRDKRWAGLLLCGADGLPCFSRGDFCALIFHNDTVIVTK